jgi:peptide/nickel transport system permease protein
MAMQASTAVEPLEAIAYADDRRGLPLRQLLRRNPTIQAGGAILLVLCLCAVFAPLLAPYSPVQANPRAILQGPAGAHLFGTDSSGMDIFSRVLFGARVDLVIAVFSVMLGAAAGIPVGTILGYLGGRWDQSLMRVLEVIQSFPSLILAMAIVSAVGASQQVVIIVIAFIAFPYYVRLVRAEMLSKRNWEFAEAAEAVGNSWLRVAFVHLLPNSVGPAVVYASLNAGYAVLVAAGLGFLGLGVPVPTPEWGLMVQQGAGGVITGHWWVAFFPGVAITLSVAGFYLLGDGLRDLMDPSMQV